MSSDYFYITARKSAIRSTSLRSRPTAPHGTARTGRIVRILTGQCHGFIRLRDDRDVFFHRGDVEEGTEFNDLRVGQVVVFELIDDAVSGARALRVMRTRPR
jgi:cold shock CspA family protein